MEIESIFVIVKEALISVQYKEGKHEGKMMDAFQLCFNQWQDIEYLEEFFETHKKDLCNDFWQNTTVEDAILHTLEEAHKFEEHILHYANKGKSNANSTLDDFIFKPLHKDDVHYIRQHSKAYGMERVSWLRIYAIRLGPNLYVVTGGAIKLVQKMQDRDHLVLELNKLELVADYFKSLGIEDASDYGYIDVYPSNY